MTNLKDIKTIFFLGIGGIGMSALARYFHRKGITVSGYDKNQSPLTEALVDEGISVFFNDKPDELPIDIDLVIYTPAVPKEIKLWKALESKNIPFQKRAEILGEISKDFISVAVAGTHGKTTVSTLITWLLHNSNFGTNAILGGISANFNENLLIHPVSRFFVTEADEYDKSFLHLSPRISIITSIDADHLDIYGNKNSLEETFGEFAKKTQPGGFLLLRKGIKIPQKPNGVRIFKYALEEKSDFYAQNIQLIDGLYHFDFQSPWGEIKGLKLGMPGWINIENAVAALAVAVLLNVDKEEIAAALPKFKGNKRRFEIQIDEEKKYIDDYAHHPKEIEKLLLGIDKLYPNKKVLGIFQPHLYSRTKDFAADFARSLNNLDELFLLPIYPAREESKDFKGISSSTIYDLLENKENCKLVEKENLITELQKAEYDVVLSIGAGDIDQLVSQIKETIYFNK